MNSVTLISPLVGTDPTIATETRKIRDFKSGLLMTFSMLGAVLATTASLGIAMLAGWQRGGLPVERAMNVTLCGVAVIYVHLLPIGWRLLRLPARICAFVMWWIGVAVVLYGQVTFFMVSQQHAGNERAASIPANALPPSTAVPTGRTRFEIAKDVAQITTDLARTDTLRCTNDCRALAVRRASLAAHLTALNVEADGARRREADEDRYLEQADRNEALRATLRADPVASVVASWLRTTETRFELALAGACAVVLEGAAVTGWLLASIAIGRARGRGAVVSGRDSVVPGSQVVAQPPSISTVDSFVCGGEPATVAAVQGAISIESDARPVMSEDELLLEKIHDAVLAGEVDPTQESIRRLLRCRQTKAGRLNRLYDQRFGAVRG